MEELSRQFKAGEINENQLKEAARDLIKGYGKDIGIDYEVVYLNKEKGLESLGRPANDYVKNKLGDDNNSNISLTTDGIDLTNADVGEKVGDYMSPEDLKYRKYYREEVLPYDENYQNFLRTILSMGLDFSSLRVTKGVTEVIDKTTDNKAF